MAKELVGGHLTAGKPPTQGFTRASRIPVLGLPLPLPAPLPTASLQEVSRCPFHGKVTPVLHFKNSGCPRPTAVLWLLGTWWGLDPKGLVLGRILWNVVDCMEESVRPVSKS